jgi:deoxyuridine 5'-triphosphate nucleotidohydrolase
MKFKKLVKWAKIPTRAHEDDLGLDLYAIDTTLISANGSTLVHTGVAAAFDPGIGGILKDRSSVASKQRLYVKAGVIDPSYRGEILVLLENPDNKGKLVHGGDKIAQMVLVPSVATTIEEIEDFEDETTRGEQGFGSSGQ